ncbi:MAG TPA: Rieske 2Fe-2S domain-containing protein [Gemmataceae bacterium]|nr:Rieske 2Fe-2S domain-containing protein [Gemmataceae bacterium]
MATESTSAPSPTPLGRRTFFQWLTYGLSAAAAAVLGAPLAGYFLGIRKRDVHWVSVDAVNRFPVNETRLKTFDNPLGQAWDGMTALTGVYVRNLGADAHGKDQFLVFAVNCAHLGCPVSWFPQSGLFMCPCHGGVYYANGERASGPPTRGLFRCVWRVQQGRLEIQAPHYPTLQDTLATGEA